MRVEWGSGGGGEGGEAAQQARSVQDSTGRGRQQQHGQALHAWPEFACCFGGRPWADALNKHQHQLPTYTHTIHPQANPTACKEW